MDEIDNSVKVGLQTMELYDVEVIEKVYQVTSSKRARKVFKLINKMKYWDKEENDRKWFHF